MGAEFDREELSGTRLKRRYLQGDDGSRTPLGFFDTMRSDTCVFAVADDGQQRCLPLENAALLSGFFSDSTCTAKLGYTTSGCVGVKYAIEGSVQCPSRNTVYSIGQTYTPVAGGLFSGTGPSACSTVMPTNYPGYTFYRLGAKLLATSFVGGSIAVEP